MNYYSKGYQSFTSSAASDLFDRARYQNTKIFLTLSALSGNIIENLLDDPSAQQRLADQAIAEINASNLSGITIDFEYPQNADNQYQGKFTDFIRFLTSRIHNKAPQAQLAVAIPSSLISNQSLYDVENLSKNSDKIFLIASDFIVPEVKNNNPSNPVFGYQENEYWANISNLLSNLGKRVPSNKLVLERAWYGNGNNYPLYIPRNNPDPQNYKQPASVQLDQDTIEKLVAGVPQKGKESARVNIPIIGRALEAEGILNSNVLAYALATIEHETDETFAPIDEIGGPINARRLGYEGGSNYFGRGFIQITHLRNYQKIGERIGIFKINSDSETTWLKSPNLLQHPR
ncbi:glycosyl hydrolase family 18 protein [Patescibacteria group bacterium]|nr:glycosyl hydrolase family 18 protein [Patescibacteria group bacterium]